jgi:large subunit ribosomal protein L13
MKTYSVKASDIERKWWLVDVSGKTLGRVATEIAVLLQGKGKPMYSRHIDMGDFVVVTNAAKVRVTGKKVEEKIYYRHTQYPGGLRKQTFGQMLEADPTRVIKHAVKGMLPHNRQGRAMLQRLKIYAGDTHPHQAQLQQGG